MKIERTRYYLSSSFLYKKYGTEYKGKTYLKCKDESCRGKGWIEKEKNKFYLKAHHTCINIYNFIGLSEPFMNKCNDEVCYENCSKCQTVLEMNGVMRDIEFYMTYDSIP